ncbi:MAG: hydroxyacylglutathione hydrolase [Candidatus Syntrophoarchaeum sp. GoM_oil]|nr:MAG: hydroxyacylglutathione hydrolase [Candidatus Syntrophoarchaeum sp. GoM_oil]
MYTEIIPELYRIDTGKPSSLSYLIRTDDRNVLIDPGVVEHLEFLLNDLEAIGVEPEEIDLVINTHDHFDHIGANKYFQKHALIAAHRYAATKIISADDEVLMCRAHGQDVTGYEVNIWLMNINVITLGDWFLKVIHTPGHTSGSICIFEPYKRFLISGDTVFADGTISEIARSGSYGEYINSLARLNTMKIDMLLPGHGNISENAESDILKAIENAKLQHEEFLSDGR